MLRYKDRSVRAPCRMVEAGVADSYSTTDGVGGELFESVGQRRIAPFDDGNIKGVLNANQNKRTLLTVGGQVDTQCLVPSKAFLSTSTPVLGDGEG